MAVALMALNFFFHSWMYFEKKSSKCSFLRGAGVCQRYNWMCFVLSSPLGTINRGGTACFGGIDNGTEPSFDAPKSVDSTFFKICGE